MISISDALKFEVFKGNPIHWLRMFGRILTKDLDSRNKPVIPNVFQERVCEIVEWCLANGKPIRLVVLKPRQKGSTTISSAIAYVMARTREVYIYILGGKTDHKKSIWEMIDYYHQNDGFDDKWGNTFDVNQDRIRCGVSLIEGSTAGAPNAGKSKTAQGLIATEVAHWKNEGAFPAEKTLNSVLAAVPPGPETFVILESTGNGPKGAFADFYRKGVEFEDFKKGNEGINGYIRVFAPWYVFPDSTIKDLTDNQIRNMRTILEEAKDEDALRVWNRFPFLSAQQMMYYHRKLESECNGDPVERRRHYPTTPQDSFNASNPSRFNSKGLDLLQDMAMKAKAEGEYFFATVEQRGSELPYFHPCDERYAEVMVVRDWTPRMGQRFIISADPMTGESNVTSSDPDTNSYMVGRDGHMDGGVWVPPEPIVCTMPLNRWDAKPGAKLIKKLSRIFGDCPCMPEVNREGLVNALRDEDVPLIQRARSAAEVDCMKPSGKFGFFTSAATKPSLISDLAWAVQNPTMSSAGLRIRFIHIVDQLRTFVRHKDGSEGAIEATGVYDDAVIALALFIKFKTAGSVFSPNVIERPIPRDIALLEDQMRLDNENIIRPVW